MATFKTDAQINWYRSPIARETLTALMQRSDARAWLQVGCQIGLFVLTGTLAYLAYRQIQPDNWVWSVPLLALALFVHGTGGPFMGLVAVHELGHKTPFKTRALNEFFLRLYSFISWSDFVWFRPSHVKHHQLTVHHGYDGEVVLPTKLNFRDWRLWLGLLAWNPLDTWRIVRNHWRRSFGKLDSDWYAFVMPESDPALRRAHRRWARLVLGGHAVLALLFILSGHWFLIVVFTFGTQYCGWLTFLVGVPQHYGMSPDVPDFRLCCRTFTCSWLPAFYYWNMQYHVEHHMYPAVPFYHLPKLRAALAADLPAAPHGLLATWRELLAIHRRCQTEPDYRHVPALPGSAGSRVGDRVLEQEADQAVTGSPA